MAASVSFWTKPRLQAALELVKAGKSINEVEKILSKEWRVPITRNAIRAALSRVDCNMAQIREGKASLAGVPQTPAEAADCALEEMDEPEATAAPAAPTMRSIVEKYCQPVDAVDAVAGPSREWLRYAPAVRPPRFDSTLAVAPTSETALVFPDLHVPYEDKKAFACAIGIVKDFKPKRGIIIGDWLDMESLSAYPKSRPDVVKISHEIHQGNLRLDDLQNASPSTQWVFLQGNHEERAERYVNENGSLDELLDVPSALYIRPRPDEYHRGAKDTLRGMTWVPITRPFLTPYAAFHHGSVENKHHAAWLAENYVPAKCRGLPLFYGHMHSSQLGHAMSGSYARCCGWLGDVDLVPRGRRERLVNWVQGLVTLEWLEGFPLHHQFVRIENGRAFFGGKSYEGRVEEGVGSA